jgi:hypothetical protein
VKKLSRKRFLGQLPEMDRQATEWGRPILWLPKAEEESAAILVIVPGWPGALEVSEEVLRGLEEDGYIQLQQPAERGGLLHVTEKGRGG